MPEQPTSAPEDRAPSPAPAGAVETKPAPPSLARVFAYRLLWVLGVVVFALDQWTKHLIAARLPFNSYGSTGIEIFPGFMNLVHVGNTGAAWSMFTGQSTLLGLLAVGTLAAIYFWRRALGLQHRAAQIAFGLLCGGILGNLVDRLRYKYVIDFIDVHFGNYTYPTFNVADSAICVGVFWYVLWSIKQPPTAASNK